MVSLITNMSSLNAQRNFEANAEKVANSIRVVAGGERIGKVSDDAAGLAISESLRSDIRGLRQAARNVSDGISLVHTVEASLGINSNILIRLRELATQSVNGAIGSNERQSIQLEFSQLRTELDRVAGSAQFNGIKLLDGTLSSASAVDINIQLGLDGRSQSRIDLNAELDLKSLDSFGLGLSTLTVSNEAGALSAMTAVENAIDTVVKVRGNVGAVQNRLELTLKNLGSTTENLVQADSTIRDADMAEEIALLTRNQILTEAASAMVSQSNLIPQNLIQILK
ncbi:MAG: flagellin FliC [Nitrospinae bacterium CG11_big_fil_rev_8_21_14_0_20_45_15]|nr:MAG: flagellin FliC [Nitrospinae bacterium CG11_big_fil_rev_8_21_14_0_20_45_15]